MEITITENKPGYNKTKLGWIPEDWETNKFNKIASFFSGGTPKTSNKKYYLGKIPFIKSGEIGKSKTKEFINDEALTNSSAKMVKKDDLLMALYGANSGEVAISKINGAINQAVLCIRLKENYDNIYIYNVLLYQKEEIIRKYLQGGQGNLSASIIKSIIFNLPKYPEQKAIANCLSTWDTAITKLDALIKAKQKLKKALMQQLLSGKKRLPGFEGEWEEKHISELFDEIKDTNDGGEHEPLSISAGKGFKSQREKFDRVIAGTSLSKYIQLKKGDFAYNKGNSKSYKMGCIYLLESFNTALVPFVFISFRPTDNVNSHFYKHYFMDHGLDRQLKRIITSGARGDGLLNVSKKDFFKLFVPYPKKKEQTAIAQVLNTADEEINLLTNQRNQLQLQKKGLMQQLLTGKKRLNYE